MIIHDWKKEIPTIPNLLSLFRLLLIPVYIPIYLNATVPAHYYLAGSILVISCLTDLIDGIIARKFNMTTTVGKILDPIADKLTQFSLILCLSIKYKILWLIIGLFILKESFQLIAGILRLHQGRILSGALFTGKICTSVLFLSCILLILFPQIPSIFIATMTIIDCMIMLIAFADYIGIYCRNTLSFEELRSEES